MSNIIAGDPAPTNPTAQLTVDLHHKLYDSLAEFNAVACWDVLRFAQQRQYLAEHLASTVLASLLEARRSAFREAIQAAQREHLEYPTPGSDGDFVYDMAVGDVVNALAGLLHQDPQVKAGESR